MKKMYAVLATTMLLIRLAQGGASELDQATDRALEAYDGQSVAVLKHSFVVRQPQVIKQSKRAYTLEGGLIHIDPVTKAEEVLSYRVWREQGAIKSISVQLNEGMWLPISKEVMNALGDYRYGKPMPEEKQQEVWRSLEKLAHGKWQRVGEALIASIAIKHC